MYVCDRPLSGSAPLRISPRHVVLPVFWNTHRFRNTPTRINKPQHKTPNTHKKANHQPKKKVNNP